MTQTVLFASPHADDESLTLGAGIRDHLEDGYDVHVLLCTTGQNSGARAKTGLDVDDFVAARDDEFMRACRRLGVRFDHMHISPGRTQDGQLTVESAESIIGTFLLNYPGAWVKTLSNLPAAGRHDDHVHLGQAAANLLDAGVIVTNGLRLYVEPYALTAWHDAHPVKYSTEKPTNIGVVRNALDEYGALDAIGGKYGIGHISVPDDFALVRNNPVSYYHLPT